MGMNLPPALQKVSAVVPIYPDELRFLQRFYDEFEPLRFEDAERQGNGYGYGELEKFLTNLHVAMLKATYIPKDTDEFLVIAGKEERDGYIGYLREYDVPSQVCACISSQWSLYTPEYSIFPTHYMSPPTARPGARTYLEPRDLMLTLSSIAKVIYQQARATLSVENLKNSYEPILGMRSKKLLAKQIELLQALGLLQLLPAPRSITSQVTYELAPVFQKLRHLQSLAREKALPFQGE